MDISTTITPRKLQTLYEVSRKINTQLNLNLLLENIMDEAVSLLNAEKGIVLLRNEADGGLDVQVFRAGNGLNPFDADAMSRTIIEKVEKNSRPVLVERVADIPSGDISRSMEIHELKSILCVPMISHDALSGVIYIDTSKEECFFTKADLDFLVAFSNLACIAIDNAKNFQNIEYLNSNLEDIVAQRTRELQQANSGLIEANKQIVETQLQLVRSEKMASLGHLVAGVSHEVNSPLASITSSVDVFERGLGKIHQALESSHADAGDLRKTVRTVEILNELTGVCKSACQRINTIIAALKNFARLDEEEFKTVDLHEGLDSFLVLVESEYSDRIRIVKDYGELPELRCQAGQVNQVFMNIFVNACQAIPDEGEVLIKTRLVDGSISISIKDTGMGIQEDDLQKIFDPGFTTKGVGVGLGLGLAISHTIVSDHGGRIMVDSQPGIGSVFTVELPCANGEN